MKVAVIGGGNIGTLMVGELASKGNRVCLYTSKPEKWGKEIKVLDEEGKPLFNGKLEQCENDMKQVLQGAEIVFVTVPSFLFCAIAKEMEPYVTKGMVVCVVPGSGGAEYYFQECLKKGIILCGMQRVYALADLVVYGHEVRRNSKKKLLSLGVISEKQEDREKTAQQIGELLDIKCELMPNYLCVTLVPSNPILHTTRLYRLFKDYDGTGYSERPTMYDTWDDATSAILFQCDEELQNICKSLDELDLKAVESLKMYYENDTLETFSNKIRSIVAFQGKLVPMVEREDGWHPDFSSRFFVADFEYGLFLMKELGKVCGVDTPMMDEILAWYQRITGKKYQERLTGFKKADIYSMYR